MKHPIDRVETRKYIYICIGGQKGFLVFYVGSNGQELRDTTEAEMMNTFFSLPLLLKKVFLESLEKKHENKYYSRLKCTQPNAFSMQEWTSSPPFTFKTQSI